MISPGATNVGHRSAAQIPKPLDSGGLASQPPAPDRPVLAAPVLATPVIAPPVVPPVVPAPIPALPVTPAAPKGPVSNRRGFAPLDEEPEDSTRRVPRIDPGPPTRDTPQPVVAEKLPVTAEYEPGLARTKSGQRRTIALLSICGVGIGAIGAVALWHYATPTPQIARTAITSPSPTPIPTPTPTATPIPTPIPTPTATPTPAATGPCPLGMALLSTPHPYCIDFYEYPGGHTIPRTQVSLADAGQICASRGLRLCTDAEWEQACRGRSGASFPYGPKYDSQVCNIGGSAGPAKKAGPSLALPWGIEQPAKNFTAALLKMLHKSNRVEVNP